MFGHSGSPNCNILIFLSPLFLYLSLDWPETKADTNLLRTKYPWLSELYFFFRFWITNDLVSSPAFHTVQRSVYCTQRHPLLCSYADFADCTPFEIERETERQLVRWSVASILFGHSSFANKFSFSVGWIFKSPTFQKTERTKI